MYRPEYLRPMRQPVGRHERRRPRTARRATWREDLITGCCSLLLVLGLYLDGWNHINLQADELGAFLTPWHGVQILDLLGVLVHNLLFIAPVLLLLRRWRPPLGSIALTRPSPVRPWASRTVAMVAPVVYWTANFAFLRFGYGVTWVLEIWLGAVVWAGLSGLVLAVLMQPTAIPLTAWNRNSSSNSQRRTKVA